MAFEKRLRSYLAAAVLHVGASVVREAPCLHAAGGFPVTFNWMQDCNPFK